MSSRLARLFRIDSVPDQTASRWTKEFLCWILFLSATWCLLRPALLTTLAADDLINPFSQLYHSGASLPTVIRKSAGPVTANGHFNYLGQAIGAFALFVWLYLIGKVGIHYGTVYASTKFLVYLILLLVAAELLREIMRYFGIRVSPWRARVSVLVTVVALIQIHIPWSNDPVASYPLAGFLTVAIGLTLVLLAVRAVQTWSWAGAVTTGVVGVLGVLYYEFNVFAVAAIVPLLAYGLWQVRSSRRDFGSRLVRTLVMILPAMITTIGLYLRNQQYSTNYEGTSVQVTSGFVRATKNGLISSLPATSWKRANEWLTPDSRFTWFSVGLVLLGGIFILGLVLLDGAGTVMRQRNGRSIDRNFWCVILGLIIYWFGATVTQTSTAKIQREASGIGQVYNYYAVGAVVVGLVGAIAFLSLFGTWGRRWRLILVPIVLVATLYQHQINSQVTNQFNRVLVPNGNLLNVFHEVRDNTQRCQALEWWKSLGWPEYYANDMEKGLDLAYVMYRGYEFCDN